MISGMQLRQRCSVFLLFIKFCLIFARPDFKWQENFELLRHRQPVSKEEPLRCVDSWICHCHCVAACMIGLLIHFCLIIVISLNRFKESLRENLKGRTNRLEYDVTLLPSTRVLDNMEMIESIECTEETVRISSFLGSDVNDLIERFQLHSVLVAGKEWGCSYDQYGNLGPTHRRILDKYIQKEQIILKTKKCSPLEAFSKHSIEMRSEPNDQYQMQDEMRGHTKPQTINENTTQDASGFQHSSRRSSIISIPPIELGPDESSFPMKDTVFLEKSSTAEISLSWDIATRVSFYLKIEGHVEIDLKPSMCDGSIFGFKCKKCRPCSAVRTVITYCESTVRVRQTATLSIVSNVQSTFSKTIDVPLVPKFPVPGLGLGFRIAAVDMGLGFFIDLRGQGSFFADGLLEMSAAVTVSTDLTAGFTYKLSRSPRFVPIADRTPITPTKSFTWGGKVTASLSIGIIPIFSCEAGFTIGISSIAELGLGVFIKVHTRFIFSFQAWRRHTNDTFEQVGPEIRLQGDLKLGIGTLALDALPASKISQCLSTYQQSICTVPHMAEAYLSIVFAVSILELKFALIFAVPIDLLPLLPPLEISLCVFVACYPSTAPSVTSTPAPEMPKDDPGYSNSVLAQQIFSTYQQAYTPAVPFVPNYYPPDPVSCVPGLTCPPSKQDCTYGYPVNGFACASGCGQTYGSTLPTCVQTSCCSKIVNAPDNALYRFAGSNDGFGSQSQRLTGGNYIEIKCNAGYILSGRNLGFQQLGTLTVGATYRLDQCFHRWGACGGSPKDSHYTPCIPGRVSAGPIPTSNTPGKIADNRCEFVQLIPGDGGWTLDGERFCTPANCGAYRAPANGIATPSTARVYGESVTITCNAGFELSGDLYTSTPTCQANGNFTSGKFCAPKTCEVLSAPKNGEIFPQNRIASRQSVFVRCEQGYETTTAASIACVNGQYSAPLPNCSKRSCGSVNVSNGIVSPKGQVTFNSSVSVTCNTGYFLEGEMNSSAVCTADGIFSREFKCNRCSNCSQGTAVYMDCTAISDTVCLPVVCSATPPINGIVSNQYAFYGENITISCNTGFQVSIQGSMYPSCNSDGMFEIGKECIKMCDSGQYSAAISG
jgi:hypothetical protein